MPHARVFVPQEAIESWLSDGRADLQRDVLIIDGRSFQVAPGVRFLAEVACGRDDHGLVGRVQSERQLDALAAEHTHEAVLLGDSAYQVAEGYLITLDEDTARAPDVAARIAQLFGAPASASDGP